MELNGKEMWLRVDADKYEKITDVRTGATPKLWRGNYLKLYLAIFWNDALVDLSNVASLTVEVFNSERTGDPLMTKTVAAEDITAVITADQWGNYTAAHATVEFTGAETNLTITNKSQAFWLCISAVTNHDPGRDITYGGSVLTLEEDGHGNADGAPAENPDLYYTQAQADARYAQNWANGAGTRFRSGYWQWYFPTEGKWRTLIPGIVDGQPSHAWGDPED
jgi:hypothetical protein